MGWTGVLPEGHSRAAHREQERLPAALTIAIAAGGITQHIPGRRWSSLGGLVRNQKQLHPRLGVLLRGALQYIPCRTGNMSLRDTENGKLCLSACLRGAAVCGADTPQQRGKGSSAHGGGRAPRCVCLPSQGQRVSRRVAITKSLCCG